jgi:hypothetical protein
MNPQGHHRIADEAGLPRLRQAFADVGVRDINLTAFYFGNWLTDLSQVRDPNIARLLSDLARDITERLRNSVGSIVAGIHSFIESNIHESDAPPEAGGTLDGSQRWVRNVKAALYRAVDQAAIDWIEAMHRLLMGLSELGPAGLDELATAGVKFIAYAKFAHPDPNAQRPGLDFRVFLKLFERNFTQYWPHEHLDRPSCGAGFDPSCCESWGRYLTTDPERLYASKLANAEHAIGSDASSTYAYLEEDRRVASAALAVIDRDWASRYFTESSDYNTDLQFHQGLADFGHALHAIEDFFAHSNFIEHAAAASGPQYLKQQLYNRDRIGGTTSQTRSVLEQSRGDFAATKIFRRLKRFTPDVEEVENRTGWAFVPEERSVVTGYFDIWDTLISLLHALEELFDFEEPEKTRKPLSDYIERYKEDRLDELIEPITDIVETVKQQTIEGKLRKDLRVLLAYYTEHRGLSELDRDSARRSILTTITDQRLFRGVPAAILDVVVTLVFYLANDALVRAQIGRVTLNLYQLIKTINEIIKNPLEFLTEPLGMGFDLKFAASWIYKIHFDDRFDTLRFELRTKLHAMLGGYRIGSHSLLAKDYDNEPLHRQAFNCARALHWYVVDTMCRWTDQTWLKQASDDSKWVDWDELLGHFLRHPHEYISEGVSKPSHMELIGYEKYEVASEGETFRTIAATKHARSHIDGSLRYGSYDEFLVANLYLDQGRIFRVSSVGGGTVVDEAAVAEIVAATGMGARVANGRSYSLRIGLILWFPFTVDVELERLESSLWFTDVMDLTTEEWQRQMAAYADAKSLMSLPPYQYHRIRYFGTDEQKSGGAARDEFVRDATTLRDALAKRYNEPGKC